MAGNSYSNTAAPRTQRVLGEITNAMIPPKKIEYVNALIERNENMLNIPVKNVTLVSAKIYRYLGCPQCTKSLHHPISTNQFMCRTCGWHGNSQARRCCMMIRNITLFDSTGMLEDVVCFNSDCEAFLGKESEEFKCDQDAQRLLETFFMSIVRLNISLYEANDPLRYPKSVKASSIVVIRNSSSPTPTQLNQISSSDSEFEIIESDDVNSQSEELNWTNISREIHPSRQVPTYELTLNPSGHVMILNNYYFPNRVEKERLGSETDVNRLKRLFENLDLKVWITEAKNNEDLKTTITRFKNNLVREQVGCSIVVAMSHGSLYQIQLTDGPLANVWTDIIGEFSDENFPEFVTKPKIFIFAACQNFGNMKEHEEITNKLSDVYTSFSAMPGQVSLRNERKGSVFIQSLAQAISKYAASWTWEEILKETQKIMSRKVIQQCYFYGYHFDEFRFNIPSLTN